MHVKRILFPVAALALFGCVSGLSSALAENEPDGGDFPPFREAMFMSELQKDDGYAQALRVGGVVFVSATTAPGGDFDTQLATIYRRLQSSLGQYGLTMANVAQERIYTTDMSALQKALPKRRVFYPEEIVPAVSWVEVKSLAEPGALLAIELMAVAEPEE